MATKILNGDDAMEAVGTLFTLYADFTSENTHEAVRTGPHVCMIERTLKNILGDNWRKFSSYKAPKIAA